MRARRNPSALVVAALAGAVALAVACGEPLPHDTLVLDRPDLPRAIQDDCALTQHRCTRCHTLGRVLAYEGATYEEWVPIVTKMRRMASSGITRADAQAVLRCLVFRGTGAVPAAGLPAPSGGPLPDAAP